MDYQAVRKSIINRLKNLSKERRFLGAYVFGSAARGEFGRFSDIDIKVFVDKSSCQHVNHPSINNVKSDISFMSLEQMDKMLEKQVAKHERVPMIAESVIIFDKTGQLRALKKKHSSTGPYKYKRSEYKSAIFLAQHFTDCIERNLESDPATALLGMHINLMYLLEIRYRTIGRWQVGSKRLLNDIRSWDKPLARVLERYLQETAINKKFDLWLSMRDHILKPLGGALKINDINCDCKSCKHFIGRVRRLTSEY